MRDVTVYNKKTGESADEETRPANRQIDEHSDSAAGENGIYSSGYQPQREPSSSPCHSYADRILHTLSWNRFAFEACMTPWLRMEKQMMEPFLAVR